ncbi:hypothetical protein JRO89_XS02G0012600 [Xanthoceras sorbifolium]|uniref:GDSL esterase/lipase n=1 Tax=Xanthoceras sorbifolium TaxID=99658 RepID=A0ABQ8IDR6_9ROSI|nr:hypothetical protein JRO89_XS02G0012600 [Xanthoceras sorbifolium]
MAKRLVLIALCLAVVALRTANAAKVPAIFIFGDSTADVGTNNFLPGSKFRANIPFNGIDFPGGKATGRFSNGLNSADLLAMLLVNKISPPPFLSVDIASVVKKKSFRGLNFASGGSGLLDITGQTMLTLMKFGTPKEPNHDSLQSKQKNVISLGEQIQQFHTVHGNLTKTKGLTGTKNLLSKSLFFISTASNDIFSYYHSGSTIPKEDFISSLGLAYEKYLRALLDLGARKFGIISVPPIGCCPSQRVYNATGGCLEELNGHARAFHATIGALMNKLSSEYKDMKYSVGNTYEMTINVIENAALLNFTEVARACCGAGKLNAEAFCQPKAILCSDRNVYLFWDLFHPTQTAAQLAAATLYGGEQRFVSPINFAQLAAA